VTGSAIFLRYSLTGFLRFWMARQSFELNILAERVFTGAIHDAANGASARDANRNCELSRSRWANKVDQPPGEGGCRVERPAAQRQVQGPPAADAARNADRAARPGD
jgi:hypothetical protein